MTYALAALVAAGIALPHALRLGRVLPATAIALWLASLALRAVSTVFAVLYVVLFLPHTELFHLFTHWCWHAVIPVLADHSRLEGHKVGDAASLVPGVVLGASLLSLAFGLLRTTRSIRRLVGRVAVGPGPGDSVIVGGSEVLLAAAGLAHPRVLVSTGALMTLDDGELAAGLDHERGHIVRRHRYVLLLAQLAHAVGRLIPGSGRALREVVFHIERDADRWALQRSNDPLALAGAICKAALDRPAQRLGGLTTLAAAGVADRVDELLLLAERPRRRGSHALALVAAAMATLVVGITALVPATAAAGLDHHGHGEFVAHCDD